MFSILFIKPKAAALKFIGLVWSFNSCASVGIFTNIFLLIPKAKIKTIAKWLVSNLWAIGYVDNIWNNWGYFNIASVQGTRIFVIWNIKTLLFVALATFLLVVNTIVTNFSRKVSIVLQFVNILIKAFVRMRSACRSVPDAKGKQTIFDGFESRALAKSSW